MPSRKKSTTIKPMESSTMSRDLLLYLKPFKNHPYATCTACGAVLLLYAVCKRAYAFLQSRDVVLPIHSEIKSFQASASPPLSSVWSASHQVPRSLALPPAYPPEPTVRRHSYPSQTDATTFLGPSRNLTWSKQSGPTREDTLTIKNGCRRHVIVVGDTQSPAIQAHHLTEATNGRNVRTV